MDDMIKIQRSEYKFNKMGIITEPKATSTPTIKPRKSILKNSNKSKKSTNNELNEINNSTKDLNCTKIQELSFIPILPKSHEVKKYFITF